MWIIGEEDEEKRRLFGGKIIFDFRFLKIPMKKSIKITLSTAKMWKTQFITCRHHKNNA